MTRVGFEPTPLSRHAFHESKTARFSHPSWQDGRVGLRRTVQVHLIPMVLFSNPTCIILYCWTTKTQKDMTRVGFEPTPLSRHGGLRRTVQVHLIPMVYNCLRVSKGAWVQIPLLSYLGEASSFGFMKGKPRRCMNH
jgi:hypothetical protein